jgi:hypothetical protein
MSSPDDTEALADILAGRWIDAGDWRQAVAELSALNEASRDKRGDEKGSIDTAATTPTKPTRKAASNRTRNAPQTQPIPGGLFAGE